MKGAPFPRSRLILMWILIVVAGVFTIFYSWAYGLILPSSIHINLTALIFLVIGLIIITMALLEIRNVFRIDELVTSGIYSKTRNPTYLGFISIIIGISLASRALLSFIWIMICMVTLYYMAKKEETDLVRNFGEDYLNYKKSVPQFIPKYR